MAWSYTVSGVVHGTVGQSLRGAPSPKRASFFDTYAVFICPTLRHETSKQKFLEGSMLMSTYGSDAYVYLEGHRKFAAHVLHSLSETTHSEKEYERLLWK